MEVEGDKLPRWAFHLELAWGLGVSSLLAEGKRDTWGHLGEETLAGLAGMTF